MSEIYHVGPIFNRGDDANTSDNPALNSIVNQMWLAIYGTGVGAGGQLADPLTFAMAMQAINGFMTLYPNQQSLPNDPFIRLMWSDLNNSDGTNPTLASLATTYHNIGFSASGFAAYNSLVSGEDSHVFADFAGDLDAYGGKEGSYTSNPQALSQRDLRNLIQDFQDGDLKDFLQDVTAINTELGDGKSPLDGVSQSLSYLLNTPLDPTGHPGVTLASLASATPPDTATLQQILKNNPQMATEFNKLFSSDQFEHEFSQ